MQASGQLPDDSEDGHGHQGTRKKIRHICISRGFHGCISDIWAVSLRWEDQVTRGEIGSYPRNTSNSHVLWICGRIDRLGSTSQPTIQRTITQDTHSFRAESVREGHGRLRGGGGLAWQALPLSGKACWGPVGQPQLTHHSIAFRTRNSRQDLQQAVNALLSKGAIERVLNEASLRFYSWLFLVPKKTGDLHPVIDLSALNRHLVVPHFKMETQASARAAIRNQEWTISIDIRDAYLHVPMHIAFRKYLQFRVHRKTYQFTCLPFGLAMSPREFTKTRSSMVEAAKCQAARLLADWLIRVESPEQAQMHSEMTIALLQRLGWVINFEKSDLTPSQDFQFLGMHFNTRQFTVAPLPKMHLKVQSVHQHWMSNPIVTTRDLHSLLGMVMFMATLVCRGRLRHQSSDGPPEHGARGPGIGQTRSQFLSGFYKKWPGGHHQQSCKVFPSPLRKQKSRFSQMHPTWAGEPN